MSFLSNKVSSKYSSNEYLFKKEIGKWGRNSWGNLGKFLPILFSFPLILFSNRSSAFANSSAFS